ncbi:o-succinylbenzoate synthase [Aeromicrobium sp. Leaf350]|uniref:o-succinylbenzoate synthase n=1 Tax=Aeromicrobium sp. Leaf350 TaxID=2876565 RepID=UPI001E3D4DC0|nr:o-succinylbenzoate synthase [Aeromicrobium sp. Leaf350]
MPIVYSLPLRDRFRGITHREGVLVEGPAGWGEFAPFLEYDDAEALHWWAAAREASTVGWPEPVRAQVPVNCIVPAVTPERAAEIVLASGCRTAKVKVAEQGQDLADDLARVAAVREALGPDGRVRVDANGAWGLREALVAVLALDDEVGLEYVEQPCASVEDLARVRRETGVLVAADESIRKAADPYRVAEHEAADVAVLKVAPLGGVAACLTIAEQIGLPVVVSSAVDSSVGLAAGLALAAALPDLPFACGLGTQALLETDVVTDPLAPVGGMLDVRRPVVDPDLLERCRADAERTAWWLDRLARVEGLAGGLA